MSDLDRLSPARQQRAAELIRGLVSPLLKGTPGRDLLHFAGTLDDESAREMIEAIEVTRDRHLDVVEGLETEAWSPGLLRRRLPVGHEHL